MLTISSWAKSSDVKSIHNILMLSLMAFFSLYLLNGPSSAKIEYPTFPHSLFGAVIPSCALLFLVSIGSAYLLRVLVIDINCNLRWIYFLHAILHMMLLVLSVSACLFNTASICDRILILLEQIRLNLKLYSVFRTIVGSKFGQKMFSRRISVENPFSASKLLYFYFAPVLIYQSFYLRVANDKKGGLFRFLYDSACHVFKFCVSVYLLLFIFHQVIGPYFANLTIADAKGSFWSNTPLFNDFEFLKKSLGLFCCLGTPIFLLCFFFFFEAWMNFWADILSFEDRSFYEDWWNSCSFSQFYRKWNCIVHDFLYTYLYGDFIRYFRESSIVDPSLAKGISALLVFNISAVVHEFIISFSLGFFYPVLFILFSGPGVVLCAFFQKATYDRRLNAIFWLFMFLGLGLTIFLYSFEYCCRTLLFTHIFDTYAVDPLVSHLFFSR